MSEFATGVDPVEITAGPDGNMWFTEQKNIGRITPAGMITEFPNPDPDNQTFEGITAGPDGNLYTGAGFGIDRITPDGQITAMDAGTFCSTFVTTGADGNLWVSDCNASGGGGYIERVTPDGHDAGGVEVGQINPGELAPGPDGNIWFTTDGGAIGRITPGRGISHFTVPHVPHTPGNLLYRITGGPDGNVWFTNSSDNKVSRMNPSKPSSITSFNVPTTNSQPRDIVSGADRDLWFTEYNGNKIGRIATSGAITEYGGLSSGAGPQGITLGPAAPRRSVWFTEYVGNRIGQISTSGAVSEYAIPTNASGPSSIVAGIDGNLWFTETNTNKIGRFNPSTHTFTEFHPPGKITLSGPFEIAAGPDGALWFTEPAANRVGRISTSGAIAQYAIPTASGHPVAIAAGPDKAVWFTEYDGQQIGRITATGQIDEFPLPSQSGPVGITLGPDANLWFTEYDAARIGRLLPAPASAMVLPAGPAPALKVLPQGTTVRWMFQANGADSVTDSTGMGLFASGTHAPVSYYAFRFVAAGIYTYATARGFGIVNVPMVATPASGTTSTSFSITWAAAPPPSGHAYDVLIRRPGSSTFTAWKTGTTATTSTFTPDSGTGSYGIEARMRDVSNGNASLYTSTIIGVTSS